MMMNTSILFMFSSTTLYLLITCFIVTVIVVLFDLLSGKRGKLSKSVSLKIKNPAPGPKPFPIIGNLNCLDGYEVPYQAFDDLAAKYGPIVSLRLGSVPAVVVNGIENIREVLITKTGHFDSRPNFRRYHQLFSGNKENSLAFCDWSDMQKARRDMLIQHSFPRNYSFRFEQLSDIIVNQNTIMVSEMKSQVIAGELVEIKPIIAQTCANVFTQYFTSRSFDTNNKEFQKMISNFDKIFFEVNQGYAADFLPFLLPFHAKNLRQMEKWSHEIRDFILSHIVEERKDQWTEVDQPSDYVESLVDHVNKQLEPKMEWETALFALEDIIGGHSAISNFLVKVFGYVANSADVQMKIQQEIDSILEQKNSSMIELGDRNQMPYTEAVIMESLRLIASPIVPHVANQDSTINGFDVKKDTLIFLNNYNLSMSEKLWTEPQAFQPERFLQGGRIVKPDFFLPFGAGRRSCMGYKLVQFLSFTILANTMQEFSIVPRNGESFKVPVGSLAMPEKSFQMHFVARN